MNTPEEHPLPEKMTRYFHASIITVVAFIVHEAIVALAGNVPPFFTLYPGVIIVALTAGFGPGLFAALLSSLLSYYYLFDPRHEFSIFSASDIISLGFFVGNCILITWLASVYIRARDKAAEYDRDAALRESEERLQEALIASHSFAFEWDPVEDRVLRSESCGQVLGLSGDEAKNDLGRRHFERIHPEDRDHFVQLLHSLKPGHETYHTEYRITRGDGDAAVLEEVGKGLFNEDGSLRRLVGTATDITGRKRAEEVQARLAAIVESSGNAIISKDLDGTIRSWNKGAEQMFGYSEEAALGQPITVLLPPSSIDEEKSVMERLRHRNQVERFDTVQLTKEGRKIDVSVTVSPVKDANGTLIGASTIITDITDRKRAEEELSLARFEAESRAKELEALMDAVPVGVLLTRDAEGREVSGNRAAHELLRVPMHVTNLSKKEPDPGRQRAFSLLKDGVEVPPEDMALHRAARGEDMKNWSADVRFDNGEVRHLLLNATPLRDEDGRPHGAIGAFIDVTDRQRAEEALKEADRRKDDFLVTLAHELRNPMAAISAAGMVLSRPDTSPDKAQFAREALRQRVSQLGRLIEDLLDVSRIVRGRVELHRENLDLESVIARAVESSRGDFDEKSQQLTVRILDALPVFGDSIRLEQVVTNLLTNASRYSPPGKETSLTAFRDGSEAVIQVRDQGDGIPASLLPRIFEAFRRGEDSIARTKGGLGLGLTIVKNLCEMHNGRISVKSRGENMGSEFEVRLPIGEAYTQAVFTPAVEGRGQHAFRILVVEDHADTALLTAAALEGEGHTVFISGDGPAAVRMALELNPDVILLDIGLPGMNGYEVAEALRNGGLRDALIIAVTGYGQERDVRKALDAGIDHHLLKPVDFDKLRAFLGRFREKQSAAESRFDA